MARSNAASTMSRYSRGTSCCPMMGIWIPSADTLPGCPLLTFFTQPTKPVEVGHKSPVGLCLELHVGGL